MKRSSGQEAAAQAVVANLVASFAGMAEGLSICSHPSRDVKPIGRDGNVRIGKCGSCGETLRR